MHFYYGNNFVTKQNVKKEGKYTQPKCALNLHLLCTQLGIEYGAFLCSDANVAH